VRTIRPSKGKTRCQFSSNHFIITTFLRRASRSSLILNFDAHSSPMEIISSCVSFGPNIYLSVDHAGLAFQSNSPIRRQIRCFSFDGTADGAGEARSGPEAHVSGFAGVGPVRTEAFWVGKSAAASIPEQSPGDIIFWAARDFSKVQLKLSEKRKRPKSLPHPTNYRCNHWQVRQCGLHRTFSFKRVIARRFCYLKWPPG